MDEEPASAASRSLSPVTWSSFWYFSGPDSTGDPQEIHRRSTGDPQMSECSTKPLSQCVRSICFSTNIKSFLQRQCQEKKSIPLQSDCLILLYFLIFDLLGRDGVYNMMLVVLFLFFSFSFPFLFFKEQLLRSIGATQWNDEEENMTSGEEPIFCASEGWSNSPDLCHEGSEQRFHSLLPSLYFY